MSRYFRMNDKTALTSAEIALLAAMASGLTNQQARIALGISDETFDNRTRSIREKLFVTTTREAIEIWRQRQTAAA